MPKDFLTEELKQHLLSFKQLVIGFSGGLDSMVLLNRLSLEPSLHAKLFVLHVNHGLSVNAHAWESLCQAFCQKKNLLFSSHRLVLKSRRNLEENARKARYAYFSSQMQAGAALLLGHHQDDQAETFLLHLLRGAGIEGLSAMPFSRPFGPGLLLRPLLYSTRADLKAYALSEALNWVEDESNQASVFSRNYLRNLIIPPLRQRWPTTSQRIAQTAAHCQEALANLDDLARLDCPLLDDPKPYLSLTALLHLKPARLKNILRFWLKRNNFPAPSAHFFKRLIEEVIFAKPDADPLLEGADLRIRRYQNTLYLLPKTLSSEQDFCRAWDNFPQPLFLPELNCYLMAKKTEGGGLLLPQRSRIEVRFRQEGERLKWHGQTKTLKKLFQAWKVPVWQRASIPLLYINEALAAVVGYAMSDDFYQKEKNKTPVALSSLFSGREDSSLEVKTQHPAVKPQDLACGWEEQVSYVLELSPTELSEEGQSKEQRPSLSILDD